MSTVALVIVALLVLGVGLMGAGQGLGATLALGVALIVLCAQPAGAGVGDALGVVFDRVGQAGSGAVAGAVNGLGGGEPR